MTKWVEKTVDSDSDVWDKKNPNPLEGKLIKIETSLGEYKSNLYTVETKDKSLSIWGNTVLDDKLLGVPLGTYIKLEYEGLKPSKRGKDYHSYKVFIDMDSVPDEVPEDVEELNDLFPE